jgi:hypothetical protein
VHAAAVVTSLAALLLVSAVAAPADAGETTEGSPAMVALATAPAVDPLPYRSQLSLTDRIKTGNRLFARLLLGGRVIVLAREGSSLAITEVPGAATIDVQLGRIAVTVDRKNLEPDDLVEIRTPHALMSVPGDTLAVEVTSRATTLSVVGTRVEVFRRDPLTGAALEPPTQVGEEDVLSVVAVSR